MNLLNQKMKLPVTCLLCQKLECKPATYIEKDQITKEPVQYYKCEDCTVEFVYPQGLDNLEEIYEEGIGEKFEIKQRLIFRLPYSYRHKKVFSFFSNLEKGSLLDIGCREGKLSWLLSKQGWEVTGVEPTKFFAQFAKDTYGLNIENCFLQEFKTDRKFDLVVLSAILEHVKDQIGFLNLVKLFMKESAHVFIRIPHDTSKWHAATHLFIHSAKSIGYAIDKAGLYITKMDTVGREFFILAKKR